jgi:opacity protein-like surface antigen
MKKVILSMAVALACVSGAYAQKQAGGEKNLEVQFTPFSSTAGGNIGISGIRFRMFNSESSAIRFTLNLGGTNTTTATTQAGLSDGDPNSPVLYSYNNNFNLTLRPGYEKHFAGTDRLSPYIGGEVIFTLSKTSQEQEYYNGTNAAPTGRSTWNITQKDGYTYFGLAAVAGVDFYFADNLYMGTEISFGFGMHKDANTTYSCSDADRYLHANGVAFKMPDHVNGKVTNWGPSALGSIRLGWLFN